MTYPDITFSDCDVASLQIYPNPTQSLLYIQWCKNVIVKLNCVDGKLIKVLRNVKEIDMSDMPNGTYLLSIFDEQDNKIKSKLIIKL